MNEDELQLLSIEGFLRRASQINMPFMVKGSVITRQFMNVPEMRTVADLDWVYLHELNSDDKAGKLFSDWTRQVTEVRAEDGVKFRSFRENDFWRRIDYAMSDDFPTVNTDLLCHVDGQLNDRLSMDISFNLSIDYAPEPLWYQPKYGDAFLLKYTCPLPLQISWKLHQTITRPRTKDIFDLIQLLKHQDFNEDVLKKTMKALINECNADGISPGRLKLFVTDTAWKYFELENSKTNATEFLKLKKEMSALYGLEYFNSFDPRQFITEKHLATFKSMDLLLEFKNVLNEVGFTEELINSLFFSTQKEKLKSFWRKFFSF